MLKSLLMASALAMAFSGTAMADDARQTSATGCESCALPTSNANAPVKLAQVQMQAQQAPGRAATRGDWENGPKEPRICCDPQLNDIKFSDYFVDDTLSEGKLT